jgi:RNA polymerase sigma factor (sigma-70 family)
MILALVEPMDRLSPSQSTSVLDRVRASWTTLRLHLKARAGDESAVNALFARHWNPLRRWAHGRLPAWIRARMDTADLVQDVMLQTFRRLDGFEVRRRHALRAYLQQGIQNRIRDELRKVARAPANPLPDDLADVRPSVLDEAIHHQREERYKRALGRLRPGERELIVGRFELEYSFEQLAFATRRRSAAAARVALGRALRRLALEMNRE